MSGTENNKISIAHHWQMADFGFPGHANKILAYIERTNPEEIDVDAIRYIQSAARKILNNLSDGKKPGADEALLLACPARKRQLLENERRNLGIAWDYYLLKKEVIKESAIRGQLKKLWCLSEERIHSIWKEQKSNISIDPDDSYNKLALRDQRIGLEYHLLEQTGGSELEILTQLEQIFRINKDQIRRIWKNEEPIRKHKREDL
ncbi:MAG: hypothetical protein ABW116_08525 [Candidatus Sedimenticola sp. 20ELBAFRAG]